MDYYFHVLRNFSDFSSRARRKEYWMFYLFNMIVFVGLTAIAAAIGAGSETVAMIFTGIMGLYGLAVIIPSIAVTIRRLHDIDKSGWFILVAFIPLIGGLILLVMMILPGTPGSNSYGSDPKG